MITITVEIPENQLAIVSDFIKKKGGCILNADQGDDLTPREFLLLQESYKEALLIKGGIIKALPVSEIWNY